VWAIWSYIAALRRENRLLREECAHLRVLTERHHCGPVPPDSAVTRGLVMTWGTQAAQTDDTLIRK
jgi:hypothetical protein